MPQITLEINNVKNLNFASKQVKDKDDDDHTVVTITLSAAMAPEAVAQLETIQNYGAVQCTIKTRQVGFGDKV